MPPVLADVADELMLDVPHHDGSPLYLPNPPATLGDSFEVLLRAPRAAAVSRVVVRQVHDGEPVYTEARPVWSDAGAQWWQATLTMRNPVVNYRFLTDSGPYGYRWITAAGPRDFDPTDAGDFRVTIHPAPPAWLAGAVAYQIFPDRFARSGSVPQAALDAAADDWATPTAWDEPTEGFGKGRARQLYGGNLYGITEHLDHVRALGVDLVYLTPVFPAPSNHRYNATSFERVDDILGGDAALADLVAEAHARDLRVIGDFTTNHTGSRHEWFTTAQGDLAAEEAGYYYFGDTPEDYEGWFGVASLPKVNQASPSVRRRMITGEHSPIRRYLRAPFHLDGWRVDVANMTGRHGADDVNAEVARDFRATVAEEKPDGYVVAEHFHDFRTDLPGDGWHGVMNYAGFAKPIWTWLTGQWPAEHWLGIPWPSWPQLPGESVVASMREYLAVPWPQLQASFTLIGSHDTARIATITGGDDRLVAVAAAALMTYPGVPMVWAGDEIGMEGLNGEHGRRPFPWDRQETWAGDTYEAFRALIDLRHRLPALQAGGLRWAYVDADRIVYLRETPAETVLVCLARKPGPPICLPKSALGMQDGQKLDTLYGPEAIGDDGSSVTIPAAGPAAWIGRTDVPPRSGPTNVFEPTTTTGG